MSEEFRHCLSNLCFTRGACRSLAEGVFVVGQWAAFNSGLITAMIIADSTLQVACCCLFGVCGSGVRCQVLRVLICMYKTGLRQGNRTVSPPHFHRSRRLFLTTSSYLVDRPCPAGRTPTTTSTTESAAASKACASGVEKFGRQCHTLLVWHHHDRKTGSTPNEHTSTATETTTRTSHWAQLRDRLQPLEAHKQHYQSSRPGPDCGLLSNAETECL